MKFPITAPELGTMDGWPVEAYPPPGFAPFSGCDLGNGDFFGLYWPTGREDEYPLVCEMSHDDATLMPRFSSYEKWTEWAQANGWRWGDAEIDDPDFVLAHLARAKRALGRNEPEEAIGHLEKATESMPDLAEPWCLLAGQRKRLGDIEAAEQAALNAARLSSWVLGGSGFTSLRLVRKDGPHSDDPLVKSREALLGKPKATEEGALYRVLRTCIDGYRDRGMYVPAITLLYNYGYSMYAETNPFRERNGYDPRAWYEEYQSLCREGLGTERKGAVGSAG